MPRVVDRLLVVEDDARLCAALTHALERCVGEIRTAGGLAETERVLAEYWPDLVLLDFALTDGDAYDVLAMVAARTPEPLVVAMSGRAEAVDAFELARRGVAGFLPKPIALDALEDELQRIVARPVESPPPIKEAVGRVPLQRAEARLRTAMIDEALKRTGGSRRAAAALLGISRQLLQYLLRQR